MSTKLIHETRREHLNDKYIKDGDYVLYWMQSSQRAEFNHSLEYAVQKSNELSKRLLVAFALNTDYPESNLRHHRFMLEGLKETSDSLSRRRIKMVVLPGNPVRVIQKLNRNASILICDKCYLKQDRKWQSQVVKQSDCLAICVESNIVVPVEVASGKTEYAARTIRPKIKKHLDSYLVDLRTTPINKDSTNLGVKSLPLDNIDKLIRKLNLHDNLKPVSKYFQGGTKQAKIRFKAFLKNKLKQYDRNRNQPHLDYVSHLSPYLHFGQISPVYLILRLNSERSIPHKEKEAFIEEIIIRRELSINFTYYTKDYDSFQCLPEWSKETLLDHKTDHRNYIYTRKQMENSQTHDRYWNAAMNEMKASGYMHNYMRMYWGKKILEWCNTPEYSYRTALYLNNKYFLDGRDPNSYANVGWIFGLHDRAWKERPIFGKVRYMSYSGLERKFDVEEYIRKVEEILPKEDDRSY